MSSMTLISTFVRVEYVDRSPPEDKKCDEVMTTTSRHFEILLPLYMPARRDDKGASEEYPFLCTPLYGGFAI
jgi:hypothetical protein